MDQSASKCSDKTPSQVAYVTPWEELPVGERFAWATAAAKVRAL